MIVHIQYTDPSGICTDEMKCMQTSEEAFQYRDTLKRFGCIDVQIANITNDLMAHI